MPCESHLTTGQVLKAALRKKIKEVTKKEFSDPLTCTRVKDGEALPLDLVRTFFRILYGGPNQDKHDDSVQRRAESSSQDALFIVRKIWSGWCAKHWNWKTYRCGQELTQGTTQIIYQSKWCITCLTWSNRRRVWTSHYQEMRQWMPAKVWHCDLRPEYR